jgi:uncharacterized membrane protein YhaH (DUF805 family)
MDHYINAWKNYAGFSGRARRTEYWLFQLFNMIILFAVIGIGYAVDSQVPVYVAYAFGLAAILPSLAVQVRRLHDIDKSGWWYFISFVPLVGPIVLLVFDCTEGTQGPNQYGPDPKQEAPAFAGGI